MRLPGETGEQKDEQVPRKSRGAAGSGGGEKTKGEASERGGRWEGVAPGWDGREAGGHNHRPSSKA